jgi:hypothetical protein
MIEFSIELFDFVQQCSTVHVVAILDFQFKSKLIILIYYSQDQLIILSKKSLCNRIENLMGLESHSSSSIFM